MRIRYISIDKKIRISCIGSNDRGSLDANSLTSITSNIPNIKKVCSIPDGDVIVNV